MADQPTIDGVSPPASPQVSSKDSAAIRQWKKRLVMIVGGFYILYMVWAFVLLVSLPADGLQWLASLGAGTMAIGALIFLAMGGIGFLRIARSQIPSSARGRGLIILLMSTVPGLLLSAAVPIFILRSPPLTISIKGPQTPEGFVAPVKMTFALDRTLQILAYDGFRAIQYRWDINGDGKVDQETVTPELTVMYDREGVYTVRVTMIGAAGGSRQAARRFIIQQSVISILPNPVIVNQPTVLSIAHLIQDPQTLSEIQWDFDNDGRSDQTTKDPRTTYTFFRTGPTTVSALIMLQNKTQARYERTFDVRDPTPLSFLVTLVSEPKLLLSPPPFPTLWRVESREDVAQVLWDFGDGERVEGKRAAHTFERQGTFIVEAKVFLRSGSSAELTSLVQIVEPLHLPDLSFEGTPEFQGDRISGEVPLTLNLKPRTSIPFIQFSWEAPDATEVGSTEITLQAIYRREGTYTVTLIGRDAENHVLRKPIIVGVKPPSSLLSFRMEPETGLAPLFVRFDASETFIPGQTITGFEWDFGDGSSPRVGGARIEHRYEQEGTYVVTLAVQTTGGKQFQTSRTIGVRSPQLTACILPSRTAGSIPLGVQFTSSCSSGNIQTRLWDFGDGSQSDEQDPIHVFETHGQYTVTLTVTDGTGRTNKQSVGISVKP